MMQLQTQSRKNLHAGNYAGKALADKDRPRASTRPKSNITKSLDPVMSLVGQLPALSEEVTRLELGERDQEQQWSQPSWGKVFALTEAIEGMVVSTKATSVEGALAQIALAHQRVFKLACEVNETRFVQLAEDCQWLLYSAVPVIEEATGVQRPEICRDRHMIDEQSPFRRPREAAK